MATPLLLICIAATASSREGRFPEPAEPLDAAGRRDAALARLPQRYHAALQASPARAAAETASAMRLTARTEPALADIDHGEWQGLSFAQIEASDPGQLGRWLAEPAQGALAGETLDQVRTRIGAWMDRAAGSDAPTCAITHPMTIRAALSHALDLPLRAALAIDVAPLSCTVLSFNRSWRLQSLGLAVRGVPG
ncbi:histidine phosphatase family protein [Novosphingobium sp.]|uniref:histidine phosphatase family protein n=1 Tax=Novosphingobium sp. TaxID=1874826 RepID=UPI003D6D9551